MISAKEALALAKSSKIDAVMDHVSNLIQSASKEGHNWLTLDVDLMDKTLIGVLQSLVSYDYYVTQRHNADKMCYTFNIDWSRASTD